MLLAPGDQMHPACSGLRSGSSGSVTTSEPPAADGGVRIVRTGSQCRSTPPPRPPGAAAPQGPRARPQQAGREATGPNTEFQAARAALAARENQNNGTTAVRTLHAALEDHRAGFPSQTPSR
ncbi:hypothetical protein SSCG_03649 [Streptomyces clavuligerus]|nr:hypothetical protein SSCG_03649 [Streptomyces clavuligerus]